MARSPDDRVTAPTEGLQSVTGRKRRPAVGAVWFWGRCSTRFRGDMTRITRAHALRWYNPPLGAQDGPPSERTSWIRKRSIRSTHVKARDTLLLISPLLRPKGPIYTSEGREPWTNRAHARSTSHHPSRSTLEKQGAHAPRSPSNASPVQIRPIRRRISFHARQSGMRWFRNPGPPGSESFQGVPGSIGTSR